MEEVYKPAYKLKKSDFKPFVGMRKHFKRSEGGILTHEKATKEIVGPDSDYIMQSFARGALLAGYNMTIVGITVGVGILAATGLAKLLE